MFELLIKGLVWLVQNYIGGVIFIIFGIYIFKGVDPKAKETFARSDISGYGACILFIGLGICIIIAKLLGYK